MKKNVGKTWIRGRQLMNGYIRMEQKEVKMGFVSLGKEFVD